jgi:hypothetical protein
LLSELLAIDALRLRAVDPMVPRAAPGRIVLMA